MSATRDALRDEGLPIDPTDDPRFDVVRVRKPEPRPRPVGTRYCVSCFSLRPVTDFDGYGSTCRSCETELTR